MVPNWLKMVWTPHPHPPIPPHPTPQGPTHHYHHPPTPSADTNMEPKLYALRQRCYKLPNQVNDVSGGPQPPCTRVGRSLQPLRKGGRELLQTPPHAANPWPRTASCNWLTQVHSFVGMAARLATARLPALCDDAPVGALALPLAPCREADAQGCAPAGAGYRGRRLCTSDLDEGADTQGGGLADPAAAAEAVRRRLSAACASSSASSGGPSSCPSPNRDP